VGYCDALSATGLRSDLREGFRRPGEGHGHQTSAFCAAVAWQRAYVERVIGTLRRECLDPMIVFGGQLVSTSSKLHQLLSPEPDAFGIGEGQPGAPDRAYPSAISCYCASAGPTARRWTDHRDSGGGWAPSSLRAARRLNGILSSYRQRPSLLRQAPVSNPAWPRTVCPPVRLSAVKTIAALDQLPLELVPNRR
jgi:hypothetical protein